MEHKDLLTSRVLWGSVVAIIAAVTTALGYDVGDQDMLVNAVVGVIGGGFAIYGRIKATTKITKVAGVKVGDK